MHGLDLTPRRTRSLLWLLNLGLLVPLLSFAGALFWGSPTANAFDAAAIRSTYERERSTNLSWRPVPPVGEQALKSTILRPDYAKRTPRHFIFSGPLPPPLGPAFNRKPDDTQERGPTDLEGLGRVRMLIDTRDERDGLLFTFREPDGRTRTFCNGDVIRADDSQPAQFRLLDVVAVSRGVFEIHYEQLSEGGQPGTQHVFVFRMRGLDAPDPGFLRPVPSTRVMADPEATALDPVQPLELDPLALRPLALRPLVWRNPRDSRDRLVRLTPASHAHFHGRSLFQLTEFIKTRQAVDPKSGEVLGLRFAGLDPKLHADVFDIRRGDILVSLDGRQATTRAGFIAIASELDPDELISVVIERNGLRYTYRIDTRDPRTIRRSGQSGVFQDPE